MRRSLLLVAAAMLIASSGARAADCAVCEVVPHAQRWSGIAGSVRDATTIGAALRALDPEATWPTLDNAVRHTLGTGADSAIEVIKSLDTKLGRAEALRAATVGSPAPLGDRLLVRDRRTMPDFATSVDQTALKMVAVAVADALDESHGNLQAIATECDTSEPVPPTILADGIAVDLDGVANHYTQPYRLVVDLGGCDVYDAGGAGNGLETEPIGVIVDLGGGADRYANSTENFAFGAAQAGIGALLDDGGDDVYDTTGYATLGAGIVGGIGILADLGGNDSYLYSGGGGGFGAQGMGTLGLGGLIDLGAGDDRYLYDFDPGETPPGFSRLLATQGVSPVGGVGMLLDDGGSDTYDAVTKGSAVSVLAQGVGDFIGVGTLVDAGGDDRYTASVITISPERSASGAAVAQGAAMLNAVGTLVDASGDDVFTISGYTEAQPYGSTEAVGQSWAFGLLQWAGQATFLDLAGDDVHDIVTTVDAPNGVAISEGQGASLFDTEAHFADIAGNDSYRILAEGPQRKVAGQGSGRGAGTGIFVDGGGDDTYEASMESQGYGGSYDFGSGFVIPGGQGLFLDGGGSNQITGPGDRGSFWMNSQEGLGVGADLGEGVDDANALVDTIFGLFGIPRP